MKAALIQADIAWEAREANHAKAAGFLQRAKQEGCDIAVFPEMFSSGFSMNVRAVAEEENGETPKLLSGLAGKYSVNIIAGLPLKKSDGFENGALAFDRSGRLVASYSKLYPFTLAGEHRHYAPGKGPIVFNLDGMAASVFICYDLRFPEAFRQVAREVQAIFVIANWPASRAVHWEALLKARAIENQCFIIGVNRTGTDGNGISYAGASRVYGPMGDDLCTENLRDEFLTVEFDPEETLKVRESFPFLKDMR